MNITVLKNPAGILSCFFLILSACNNSTQNDKVAPAASTDSLQPVSGPLVKHIYTADPSAHVFEGKLYVYPSHDIEAGISPNENGDHFAMQDYHILSMDSVGGEVKDNGVALDLKSVPWAKRQLWAPDAAYANGLYYLYFPAKDSSGIFRIGVATSTFPAGPFKAEPAPIAGTFSIDPAVFQDADGSSYIYFGGIRGGQLQRWRSGKYELKDNYPDSLEPALSPKIARLKKNMLELAEPVKDVQIVDENGKPLTVKDNARRFFEAAWMHRYNGRYYFSYSTGDTHLICYATGDSPYGPFTYRGVILNPVIGWTSHHSITTYNGKWYLFYHDSQLSGGKTHLRTVKVTELHHNPDGTIQPIDPNKK